ncbi:MAG TPA: carboxypeptidase-like regulatory domain-containing protein [Rhodothermales bacterium]|nr:carboxypeptidase-like regulatory domain-containing protein [Rhodothermales bacterium]
MKRKCWSILLLLVLYSGMAWAQSGKIAGRVTDAATGLGLPGVTLQVLGTTQGNVSDTEGYFSIINVRPGTYTIRVSFIGYETVNVSDVRVSTNLTTPLNVQLKEETTLTEVTVIAERPVVQKDVSNSTASIGAQEVARLPVASVTGAVGLQAGIQGLSFRGSGSDELSFNVNGLTLRDERDNSPITNIPLSSVEEIQVQTGGFNAEYGNVRSGVVNVITKEGKRDRYEASINVRYSPPTQKNIGPAANDLNSYWIRRFIDPQVAMTGTGSWDQATRDQYGTFEGWIAVAEKRLKDDDPTNDMTPEALQKAFLWQHRKNMQINRPDYNVDFGFGGPIPGLNKIGNTRFYASFIQNQDMYMIPLNTDRYQDYNGHVKITSDVAKGMKFSIEGMMGRQSGTSASRSGSPGFFRSASGIASNLTSVSFIDSRIFSKDYWNPTDVNSKMFGATFNHALNGRSYYEVQAAYLATEYDTVPGEDRDLSIVQTFGGVGFDEGPYGFMPNPSNGVDGMRMGVGMSNSRDSSFVGVFNLKGNYTNQLNRFLQVRTGFEVNQSNTKVNYGNFDSYLPSSNSQSKWDRSPVRGALFAQTKLEFNGMVANLGLRADYFHAGGDWYVLDPFSNVLSAKGSPELENQEKAPTKKILEFSPRVGVSFPVTTLSKLYFNYGHFRSMPAPENLFLVRYATTTGQITRIANPNNPLPKTVAYELGYEQSVAEQFLIRVAGYYKDVSLQPYLVNYVSKNNTVNYTTSEPNLYEDIRGFEVTLSRNRGWLQGFVNFTYMVNSSGYFGYGTVYQNPQAMRNYVNDDAVRRAAQSKPQPYPYGRLNIDLISPDDWGPKVGSIKPLGGWKTSFIVSWQDGGKATWVGGGSKPGVERNVDVVDFWNTNLRFAKSFYVGKRGIEFFADVFNVLNAKRLSAYGYFDGVDINKYRLSLHLPESPDYPNIPGNDKFGTFRKPGVAYQPTTGIQNRSSITGSGDVLYYEFDTKSYIQFQNGQWVDADKSFVDAVLSEKRYIDMPNQEFLNFLDPRDFWFGLRIKL